MASRGISSGQYCREAIGYHSLKLAYVAVESRDALSLGNLMGERPHFAMRLGGCNSRFEPRFSVNFLAPKNHHPDTRLIPFLRVW